VDRGIVGAVVLADPPASDGASSLSKPKGQRNKP
jgi:hypothetical protein